MKFRFDRFAVISLALILCGFILPQSRNSEAAAKGAGMAAHARGTFEVKVTPQKDEINEGISISRMTLDKQFHGDLEGSSKGQMLSYGTGGKGSSGVYVAIEQVSAKLNGKSGSFVLYHQGLMTRGVPQMSITVAPDSGTGELAGISGTMTINIADGKHSYDFEYTLQ